MALKKKKIEGLRIERVAAEGKTIGYYEGKVVFVEGAAPGDLLDAEIFRKKKRFYEARPLQYHEFSSMRAEPFCKHYDLCGGCKWQHLEYIHQLNFKQQQVADSFERIAKIPYGELRDIIASDKTRFYRNKLEFTFSNRKWLRQEEIDLQNDIDRRALGFHIPGHFDRIIDIEECHLQSDISNQIKNLIRQYALKKNISFYDVKEHQGILRNLIIRNTLGQDIMVILQLGEDRKDVAEEVLNHLIREIPTIRSAYYIINTKKNDSFFDLEPVLFYGEPFLFEEILGLSFMIGPKSFFQTNPAQANILYQKALQLAEFKGNELVYDLYTGTGTLALLAAKMGVSKVIGIENVEAAIDDARTNAINNGIDNVRFYAGDARELFTGDILLKEGKPDVIITDPPRAGMHPDVVETILLAEAPVLIYVSCNPATQARDAAMLASKYELQVLQPVDMFPHTHHVENIAKFTLKS
ncbi:MAG: 23S rRNA (uracil(1939)-C(5))-methyltransferase RlmD [Cyclobacteriaceae bacterium]|nr:23S rRNA (uracil(1939)-C(5))-methyltransferase RlmD [Cyclobacteriaceae bacterium]